MLIAQLSDTHMVVRGERSRVGRDPAAYLEEAVRFVNSLAPLPDVVLLTGDLANRGRAAEYERFAAIISALRMPAYLVPGNHDRRVALRNVLSAALYPNVSGERMNYVVDDFAVRLVAIDSVRSGHSGGVIDEQTRDWLDSRLAESRSRPTLVFLHHPPFRTGVRCADMFGFQGLNDFVRVIERHAQVIRIVCGHLHCVHEARIGNAMAISAISTAMQIVPEVLEARVLWLRPEPGGVMLYSRSLSTGLFHTKIYRNRKGVFVADS